MGKKLRNLLRTGGLLLLTPPWASAQSEAPRESAVVQAAVIGYPAYRTPAPPPVMDPVKWMPDPIESPLKSGSIPWECSFRQLQPITPITDPNLLDCWLTKNPAVANTIDWQIGGYDPVSWQFWPEDRKAALREAFKNAWLWHESGLTNYPGPTFNEPIENMEAPYFDQQPFVRTVLDENAQAWPLYLATTGHVLAAEIFGWVPWSIRDMPDDSLSILLSAYQNFYRDYNDNTWYDTIYPGFGIWGESTPAHPAYTYKFLVDNNLIGTTQTETIERVLDWARANLWHMAGSYTWDNMFHTFGYYGAPPVARVIEGTVLTHPYYIQSNHPYAKEPHHWTAECFGTVRFLANVLRLANIPVRFYRTNEFSAGHAQAYFPTIARYLEHGDDPYGNLSKGFQLFPARQLLIDQTMWEDWFFYTYPEIRLNNIGRRVAELSIFFPSPWALNLYCSDQANSLSHADGQVAAYYTKYYSVDLLEGMGLWQRLDKAAQQHGCAQ